MIEKYVRNDKLMIKWSLIRETSFHDGFTIKENYEYI